MTRPKAEKKIDANHFHSQVGKTSADDAIIEGPSFEEQEGLQQQQLQQQLLQQQQQPPPVPEHLAPKNIRPLIPPPPVVKQPKEPKTAPKYVRRGRSLVHIINVFLFLFLIFLFVFLSLHPYLLPLPL